MNQAATQRTIRAYYIAKFADSAYFPLAVYLLFYHDHIGLNFTQAMILFCATWIPSMIFDLFGGAIADKYGRKRTYIVGTTLYILGSLLPVLLFKNFYVLVGLAIVGGYGSALMSNTLSAIIAEIQRDDQRSFQRINAHSQVMLFLARIVASLLGGWLYSIAGPLPFIAYIIACVIAAVAASFMYEPQTEKPNGQTHQIALEAIAHIRKDAPIVLRTAFVLAFAWFAGDILFSYYQVFFSNHAYGPAALGVIFAAISLLSAFGAWLVKYLHHAAWRTGILAIALIVTAINSLGFVTDTSSIALVTVMMMAVISGFGEPTIRLIANEHSPSRLRSSILSVASSIASLGTILGFLVAGLVADHGSAAWAGGLAATIALSGLLLYRPARASKKAATQPELIDRGTPSAEGA